MIKAKSIRHTGVPVSDVRKARRFYGDILGFDEIERPNIKGIPGIWYEVDGTQVHIIGQRNAMAGNDMPGIGTHIAVQVEDLEEAKRVLKKKTGEVPGICSAAESWFGPGGFCPRPGWECRRVEDGSLTQPRRLFVSRHAQRRGLMLIEIYPKTRRHAAHQSHVL